MNSKIITQNPHNGESVKEYNLTTGEELEKILKIQKETQKIWKTKLISERSSSLRILGATLLKNKEIYAQIIHVEMGKKIPDAVAEIEKCAACASYYAENAEKFLEPQLVSTEAKKSFVSLQPIGIVLAIMPWNFPFWQAFRAAIPAILVGNTVILKHASNVSGSALAIEEIFSSAFELPVFHTILTDGNSALELIKRKEIAGVTFTGSTQVGKKIAATAGEFLKKSVLELGGSDPYLIFDDADLPLAAKACAYSRLINAGQSCIAAKRMIVHKNIKAEFEILLQKEMEAITIGPMARADLRKELHEQVLKSIFSGAKLLCGGFIPEWPGFFYPQTILTNVKPGMPAHDEELFGPVAAIIEAESNEHAIEIANNSDYGLGAAIFSKNLETAEKTANEQIEAGSVFVNNFVRSDSRLPFGGIKHSGHGRELSLFGLSEFANIKTVWVD